MTLQQTALNMLGAKLNLELTPLGIDLVLMHPGWVKTVRFFLSSRPFSQQPPVILSGRSSS